jgi:hypothetical protein
MCVQSFTGESSAVFIWRGKRWSENDRKNTWKVAENDTKNDIAREPARGLLTFFLQKMCHVWGHIVNRAGKVTGADPERYSCCGAFSAESTKVP